MKMMPAVVVVVVMQSNAWDPTCWIGIHVYLRRTHTDTNTKSTCVTQGSPDVYIFKASKTVFFYGFRVFNM